MRSLPPLSLCALLLAGPTASAQDELPPDAPITKLPSLTKGSEAVYPKAALQDRVSAKVVLEIDIGTDGSVEGVNLVESSTIATQTSSMAAAPPPPTVSSTITAEAYGFVASATTAAAQLEFSPAESNGTPVPVRIAFTFNFEPPPLPPPPPPRTDTSTAAAEPEEPGIANFIGDIRERGTRDLLAGVVVTVFRDDGEDVVAYETTTDAEGHFEFFDLEPGIWRVQSDLAGYFPVRDAEKIEPNKVTDVTYFIEKGAYNPYEVVVVGERVIKEVNRRTLTREEIIKVPGTLGDPVTVVQNLPGVARVQGGDLIVRGSGPQDTGVFIDGIEVPLIFHFGGLKSVIPAELIDTVDFYPGNYSVYYGRYTGGVFDANLRTVEPEAVHGVFEVSLLDVSLFLEAPITDELTVAVGGRRSWIDAIVAAAIPDDSDIAITTLPVYYDYQALVNWRPSAAHEVRASFLGSDDSFAALFENPSDFDAQVQASNLSASTAFQRGILEYRYKPSTRYQNRMKLAVGRDTIDFNLGDQFFFILDVLGIQGRQNMDWTPTEWLQLTAGVDAFFQIADVTVRAPRPPREGEVGGNPDFDDVQFSAVENSLFASVAPFVEAKIDLFDERLSLVPGLRLDYFSSVDEWSFDPRINGRFEITPEWYVKGGVGLVHQQPLPQETDENFGNPDIGLQRAVQYSVGGEWLPTDYLKFDVTFFVKQLQNLVSRTDAVRDDGTPVNVANDGSGLVYGAEIFLEHKFHDNFRGWLSYTLSRALRRDAPGEDYRLFDFDQTHILTLVASYILPENWEVGVRWRFVSGNPTTPFIDGYYLSDFDRYSPIPGPVNSGRLPVFHQLDLRVDKTWVFDWWQFSAFLSLLNTYNQTNTEGTNYEFDFSRSEPVQGLPILPILGVRAKF